MAIPRSDIYPRMTVEQYLRFEEESETKHEYHDGLVVDVLDMAGTSPEHARITPNVSRLIGNALVGKPCAVYSSDLKIWIHNNRRFLYPDLSIVCGKPTAPLEAGKHAADNPKVIIEVLSPSSAGFDRGGKFRLYKQLPSFEEYVVIEQHEPAVDVSRRQPDGSWNTVEYLGLSATLELVTLGLKIPLADVYAGVEFPPSPSEGTLP